MSEDKNTQVDKGASAPKETFENKQTASTEDITAVLHFDPFKKGEEIPEAKPEDKGTAKAAPAGKADAGAGDVKIPAKEESNLPTPKKEAEPAKPSTDWEAQAKHWREIAEAKSKPEGKVEYKKEDDLKIPDYNFTIPDPLIDALTSDKIEDFKGGLQALLKGMAGAIHAQMSAYMEQSYKPRFDGIPGQIIQTLQAHQQAKAINDDFYGKYPELNHPQIRNLVKETGAEVAKKLGKNSWDEELRDEVAKQVKAIIAVAAGVKTNGKDNNPPPRMLPSGGARSNPTPLDERARDIADTLFSQF